MPELPELQAHAERLDAEVGGAVLAGFRPITFTALKTYRPDPSEGFGSPVGPFGRRGKYLLVPAGPRRRTHEHAVPRHAGHAVQHSGRRRLEHLAGQRVLRRVDPLTSRSAAPTRGG